MEKGFRALVLDRSADGVIRAAITTLNEEDLPAGSVSVDVEYSTLNYKDGMILKGLGRLVRDYPHVPGIDFAGRVSASHDPRFVEGDAVVLTGWGIGERHWGGYAARARAPGGWLVRLPEGLSTHRAMAFGTAGFTAMLAADAIEDAGIQPVDGEVLVTGAGGGVGGIAIAALAARGYSVTAVTGRAKTLSGRLKGLGARAVIDRAALAAGSSRPLDKARWAACVDAVGGPLLAAALSQMKEGGVAAACGLAASGDVCASLLPFLLRGVRLQGVNSVYQPLAVRERIWHRIAGEAPLDAIEAITETVPLSRVPALADAILAGRVAGRSVVDVRA